MSIPKLTPDTIVTKELALQAFLRGVCPDIVSRVGKSLKELAYADLCRLDGKLTRSEKQQLSQPVWTFANNSDSYGEYGYVIVQGGGEGYGYGHKNNGYGSAHSYYDYVTTGYGHGCGNYGAGDGSYDGYGNGDDSYDYGSGYGMTLVI